MDPDKSRPRRGVGLRQSARPWTNATGAAMLRGRRQTDALAQLVPVCHARPAVDARSLARSVQRATSIPHSLPSIHPSRRLQPIDPSRRTGTPCSVPLRLINTTATAPDSLLYPSTTACFTRARLSVFDLPRPLRRLFIVDGFCVLDILLWGSMGSCLVFV